MSQLSLVIPFFIDRMYLMLQRILLKAKKPQVVSKNVKMLNQPAKRLMYHIYLSLVQSINKTTTQCPLQQSSSKWPKVKLTKMQLPTKFKEQENRMLQIILTKLEVRIKEFLQGHMVNKQLQGSRLQLRNRITTINNNRQRIKRKLNKNDWQKRRKSKKKLRDKNCSKDRLSRLTKLEKSGNNVIKQQNNAILQPSKGMTKRKERLMSVDL